MRQINTFYYIEKNEELEELIILLDNKFGLVSPQYKHKPTNFPVVLTYQFTNDINGASVYFKHISIEQIESLVTSLSPST